MDRGDYGSFVIGDRQRRNAAGSSLVATVKRLAAAATKQIVIRSNSELTQWPFHLGQSFAGATVDDGQFDIDEWTRPEGG